MGSEIDRTDQGPVKGLPALDFSSVLARTIESIQQDPAQLRNAIYELARMKLQREAWLQSPRMSVLEQRRMMLALETAIERVETLSSHQDELRALQGHSGLGVSQLLPPELGGEGEGGKTGDPPEPILIIDHPSKMVDNPCDISVVPAQERATHSWGSARGVALRGGLVAVLALGLLLILDRQFDPLGRHSSLAVTVPAGVPEGAKATLAAPGLPLPSSYGVYAVGDARLYELEALPGRVPDQRVFMSTPVKAPSRTVVPEGPVQFIVYRRDVAAAVPERVQVRVIARIKQAMSFSTAGAVSTAAVSDQWTIRGNSYELRVAPVTEHPEMLLLRPEDAAFVFPAGRYGLVIKGQAYDFTVAGDITDPAQCLERTEAANGAFYSECRNP
jgi:hypothetical protein